MAGSEQPNTAIARRLWNAAAAGDGGGMTDLFAPDVVWHSHGRSEISGEYKGVRACLEYLARMAEVVEDLRSTPLGIYASEAGAVIHYRTEAHRGPKQLNSEGLMLLGVEGGRLVRVDTVPFDQAKGEAFWRLD